MDWSKLFAAAGLDQRAWTEAPTEFVPATPFDEAKAWQGTLPGLRRPVRIEAAAWRGRPVRFELIGPWAPADAAPRGRAPGMPRVLGVTLSAVVFLTLVLGIRNWRAGRGDQAGATRVGVWTTALTLVAEMLTTHPTATREEVPLLAETVGLALFLGAVAWFMYVSREPMIRRHAPELLVSWAQLVRGEWRSPVLAGHVLAGVAVGTLLCAILAMFTNGEWVPVTLYALKPLVFVARTWQIGALFALGYFFIFALLRYLLRNFWLASAGVLCVLYFAQFSGANPAGKALGAVLLLVVGLRFGMVAFAVCAIIASQQIPFTTELSTWYASAGITYVAMALALTAYGFHYGLAGRKWGRNNAEAAAIQN